MVTDSWAFPGGALDENEVPEQAIVREIKEEVGLDVAIVPIGDELVWGQTNDLLDNLWRCVIFRVKQTDPTQEPKVCPLTLLAKFSLSSTPPSLNPFRTSGDTSSAKSSIFNGHANIILTVR